MLGSYSRFGVANIDLTGLVVPRRNAVPPPELATDAPILNVTHPCKIGVFPLLWYELNVAVFYGRYCGDREFFGIDIPLIRQIGLDDNARAIAARYF